MSVLQTIDLKKYYGTEPVSYTHLDVYKRQAFENVSPGEVPLIRPHKVLHTGLRFLRFVLYTASNLSLIHI